MTSRVPEFCTASSKFSGSFFFLGFFGIESLSYCGEVVALDPVNFFLGDNRAVTPGSIRLDLRCKQSVQLGVDIGVTVYYQILDTCVLVRIGDNGVSIGIAHEPLASLVVHEALFATDFTNAPQLV